MSIRIVPIVFFALAVLATACPAPETAPSPADACDVYVMRMMACNEPARVETWLVPTADPAIPLRNCLQRMDEPRIADGVRCVMVSDGSCEQLYACRDWTAWKYSTRFPDPDRPPPPHMRRGGD